MIERCALHGSGGASPSRRPDRFQNTGEIEKISLHDYRLTNSTSPAHAAMTPERPASRREFLRGRASVGSTSKQTQADTPKPTGYLEQYTKDAMACRFEILLNRRQFQKGPQAVADGFELLDLLEDQLSIYRDHSEVSQLNRSAPTTRTPVETRLFHLLKLAEELYEATGGAFDITSSPLTKLWGFDKRSGTVPDANLINQTLSQVGSDQLALDQESETVSFNRPELKINLGGIGKGYAIDRMAQLFNEREIDDFIVHGGQSSVLARGNQDDFSSHETTKPAGNPTDSTEDQPKDVGWAVGLSHPTVPDFRLAEFKLRNQALGTSGTGRQGFFHQGKRYGHIIDPRTGWPTNHVLSSTVISPSAALSDALATAFFVMELSEVETYCNAHPEISALLVVPSKAKGKIDLEWFNLSDDQWRRLA